MKEPKIIIDTVLNEKLKAGNIELNPITIRRYAMLELIESPFVNSNKDFDIKDIIPSCYVLWLPNSELRKYTSSSKEQIIEDAFDWSEDIDLSKVPELIKLISDEFKKINKASEGTTSAEDNSDGKKS